MGELYVYLHVHHDTGYPVVFYVGKGSGKRAWSRARRSNMWKSVADRHGFDVVVHRDGLEEREAFALEAALIRSIGRRDLGLGPLVNFTDGGEGTAGHKRSAETRVKMSKAAKGRIVSPETRAKLSVSRRKRTIPAAVGVKISASNMGRVPTDETRAKLSAAAKVRASRPAEQEANTRRMQVNWDDPQTRAGMVQGMRKAWTPERRARQAEIMRERQRKRFAIDSLDRSPPTP